MIEMVERAVPWSEDGGEEEFAPAKGKGDKGAGARLETRLD